MTHWTFQCVNSIVLGCVSLARRRSSPDRLLEGTTDLSLAVSGLKTDSLAGSLYFLPRLRIWTKLRPRARELLQGLAVKFDLHVYTMGSASYAATVAALLDPDGTLHLRDGDRIISKVLLFRTSYHVSRTLLTRLLNTFVEQSLTLSVPSCVGQP